MLKKVLIVSGKFSGFEEKAKAYFMDLGIELIEYKINGRMTYEELRENVKGISGLIAGPEEITEEIMDAAGKLEVVCAPGVGVDHIDVKAASKRGIAVCNCAGSNKDAVAEMVIAQILCLATKVHITNRNMHEGKWKSGGPRFEVKGKTLGIIGAGNIGKALAQKAIGLGMKILLYDVFTDEKFAKEFGVQFTSLEVLLRQSDYISLNCPLTQENENLISYSEFDKMKPTACVINAARGKLIDEVALLDALKKQKIAGAGLDAYSEEPLKENPFMGFDNVIMTTHVAGTTNESKSNAYEMAVLNISTVLKGDYPINCVNFKDIQK